MEAPFSCLPAPKKQRPRTGTELPDSIAAHNDQVHPPLTRPDSGPPKTFHHSISDYLVTTNEQIALDELKQGITTYMLQKVAVATKHPTEALLNIQDYFACTSTGHTEKSNVYHLNIMHARADNKDTLMSLLYDLHDKFIKSQKHNWLVIEGDAKVYELLQALKTDYKDGLKWVVPLTGDWHTLKNYQIAPSNPTLMLD